MKTIEEAHLYLKDFSHINIYTYIEFLNNSLASNVSFASEKGLQMFKEKFVAGIMFDENVNEFIIEAKVKAEMKKSEVYKVSTKISMQNEISGCKCSCPAGFSPGSCKHVFSLLHALEEYSRLELYLAPTEKLQAWHRPKPAKFSPKSCDDLFKKPRVMPVSFKPVNLNVLFASNRQLQFKAVMKEYYTYVQTHSIPLPATVLSETPPFTLTTDIVKVWFIANNLCFDLHKIWELEELTRKQSNCDLWKKERIYRLTASNFHLICKRRDDYDALARTIYNGHNRNLSHVAAIAFGANNEKVVRNQLRGIFSSSTIRKVGLVTNPFFPNLAASSDGLIHNKNDAFVLEIKCVMNPSNKSLEELAKSNNFYLEKDGNNEWKLKTSHAYYYQIQGQMAFISCLKAFILKK